MAERTVHEQPLRFITLPTDILQLICQLYFQDVGLLMSNVSENCLKVISSPSNRFLRLTCREIYPFARKARIETIDHIDASNVQGFDRSEFSDFLDRTDSSFLCCCRSVEISDPWFELTGKAYVLDTGATVVDLQVFYYISEPNGFLRTFKLWIPRLPPPQFFRANLSTGEYVRWNEIDETEVKKLTEISLITWRDELKKSIWRPEEPVFSERDQWQRDNISDALYQLLDTVLAMVEQSSMLEAVSMTVIVENKFEIEYMHNDGKDHDTCARIKRSTYRYDGSQPDSLQNWGHIQRDFVDVDGILQSSGTQRAVRSSVDAEIQYQLVEECHEDGKGSESQ